MESSVAAPGTKVPLAGAGPGLAAAAGPVVAALRDAGTLGPTPGGSPRLLQGRARVPAGGYDGPIAAR